MAYTKKDIKIINSLTTKFYSEVEKSFSDTRQYGWHGWEMLKPYIEKSNSVLDLGCGNLRFEKYISENFPYNNYTVDAIDNGFNSFSYKLKEKSNLTINFIHFDIVEKLLNNDIDYPNNKYDLVVCFGLFHHIPDLKLRNILFKSLENCVSNKGFLIISFWEFMKNDKLSKKAAKITNFVKNNYGLVNLEPNDFFLSWQDRGDVFRFCHNFSDIDIKDFIEFSKLNLIDQYSADGPNDNLNKYIILQNNS